MARSRIASHTRTTEGRLDRMDARRPSSPDLQKPMMSVGQREDLDRRLDRLEAEGPIGRTWDEVRRDLIARSS